MNKNLLKQWEFFPIVYATIAPLNFYFINYYDASLKGLLITLFASVVVVILFWVFSFILLRDKKKSALFAFACSTLLFAFQNIVSNLVKIAIRSPNVSLIRFWMSSLGQRVVLISIVLVIIIIFILIRKLTIVNPLMIKYLNIFSILLLLVTVIYGLFSINQHNDDKIKFVNYWENEIDIVDPVEVALGTEKPDIYYIIFDGFARSDILLDLYGIDNSAFIHALETRGFYIASESFSNYTQTRTSLASSLNMRYLDEAADYVGSDKAYYYPAYHMINNSIVEKSLRSLDYTMVSFRAVTTFTNLKDSDIYYQPKLMPDYYTQSFISSTAMSVFLNPQLYRWHYTLINYVLNEIPNVASIEGPKFVFAHILCPHPPFVFDRNGSFLEPDRLYTIHDGSHFVLTGSVEEYQRGYSAQIVYLQDEIIKMIDGIFQNSDSPFIIILQADHGSGMLFDHESLSNSNVRERLSILNAVYFYDQDYDLLYPQISPVNTFRIVFSNFLGINKPFLEDKHYYTEVWNLFNFRQVDDLLK